ncbi:tetratricopeptide repeat protein [Polyangium spumosum]|uniref:Tetratricopeptide repeat protein n=1 Tax=Polyangium spumosum TaxID=889282 RepID=A0A6N7PJZ2_9BACT|nr:hypothetical protein [Polyangium spumosum]MRG92328.1 hypothetical protein [Polyangium spumosum]
MNDEIDKRKGSPQQAEMLRTSGLYADAIDCFTAWLAHNANDSWSLAHRGAARAALGDHRGAIADLDLAIEMRRGRYPWAFAQKGEAHRVYVRDSLPWIEENLPRIEQEIDRSLASFAEAIKQSSGYAWAYAHKGAMHAVASFIYKRMPGMSGDAGRHFSEGSRCFEKAAELNGAYAWAIAFHALLHATNEDFTKAQALMGLAMQRNVNHDLHQHRAMAELLYYGGQYKEALVQGWLTRQVDPEDILVLYFIAQSLHRTGSANAKGASDLALDRLWTLLNINVLMISGLYYARGEPKQAADMLRLLLGKQNMETLFIAHNDPVWQALKNKDAAGDEMSPVYHALISGKDCVEDTSGKEVKK